LPGSTFDTKNLHFPLIELPLDGESKERRVTIGLALKEGIVGKVATLGLIMVFVGGAVAHVG
jgi:hypothetical protein